MDFGTNLRNLRVQRKITQQQMANDLGFSQSTINAYERNTNEPSFKVIEKIAEYFGISPFTLLPFVNDSKNDSSIQYGEIIIGREKLRELIDTV